VAGSGAIKNRPQLVDDFVFSWETAPTWGSFYVFQIFPQLGEKSLFIK
jgi:hypothetical protein